MYYINLIGALMSFAIGIFLVCTIKSVNANLSWYIGYIISAFIVGLANIIFFVKVRKHHYTSA